MVVFFFSKADGTKYLKDISREYGKKMDRVIASQEEHGEKMDRVIESQGLMMVELNGLSATGPVKP